MRKLQYGLLAMAMVGLLAGSALAGKVEFSDPKGDDFGPGEYVYPTDAVYVPGSFDLTKFKLEVKGDNAEIDCTMGAKLEDPWRMGTGFSVQMIFVFIDTGEGGNTDTLPGLNVKFAEGHEWDYVVILSPQKKSRVTSEIRRASSAGSSSTSI